MTRSGGFLTAVLCKSAARKTPLLDASAPTEPGGYRYGRDEPCSSTRTLRQYSAKPSATAWAYSGKLLLRCTPLNSPVPTESPASLRAEPPVTVPTCDPS